MESSLCYLFPLDGHLSVEFTKSDFFVCLFGNRGASTCLFTVVTALCICTFELGGKNKESFETKNMGCTCSLLPLVCVHLLLVILSQIPALNVYHPSMLEIILRLLLFQI